jgi:DNA-binding NtrC family response regulator
MSEKHQAVDAAESPVINVLVIDDDQATVDYIKQTLAAAYNVLHADSAESAYPFLASGEIAVMICSEYLQGENGLIFMARTNKEFPNVQPVLMSEGITEDLLAFAINDIGVLKYLKKPLSEKPLIDAASGARTHYLKALATDALHSDYKAIIEETQSLPYMARRVKEATPVILANIGTSATAASGTLLLIFTLIAILGVAVTLGVYSFKSILGIDLFSGSHITDLFN